MGTTAARRSPPPPPGNSSPPPPPPGTDSSFLPNNLMTMQGGAVKYTPSNANGDWKALCQIPAQAMAVDYGASLTPAGSTTAQADAAWLALLWTGNLNARDAPPGLSTTMNNTKTQYDTNLLNVPLFMSGTTYFDAARTGTRMGCPRTLRASRLAVWPLRLTSGMARTSLTATSG